MFIKYDIFSEKITEKKKLFQTCKYALPLILVCFVAFYLFFIV